MGFSKDFVWGAATASYQIEGAFKEDGKGLSVWDQFSHSDGKTFQGEHGDVACDHYHLYEQDTKLMKEIGLKAYRFSVSWPRVLPDGKGKINAKGLDFYDRLVDSLLANGVDPWVTLFHWDFPLELYKKGGWLNPESPDWFAEYTKVLVDKLSDRVSNWFTLNEPQCFIGLGLYDGDHAPGLKLPWKDVLLANQNALIAHGKAVQVIRKHSKITSKVGCAPIGVGYIPLTNSADDVAAARLATVKIHNKDEWNTPLFADPILLGKYPEESYEVFKGAMPKTTDAEFKEMNQPLDFFGINVYHSQVVSSDGVGGYKTETPPPGASRTQMGWCVTPESLYYTPKFLYERYKLPIVITENGMSTMDVVSADGTVSDQQRIEFLKTYLYQLKKIAADGVPISGYFQWSLMDNYEWAFGYSKRFGLIHVDFGTQKRTLKNSAHWYRKIIESNGEALVAEGTAKWL